MQWRLRIGILGFLLLACILAVVFALRGSDDESIEDPVYPDPVAEAPAPSEPVEARPVVWPLPPEPEPVEESGPGVIHGTVIYRDGTPAAGAEVTLGEAQTPFLAGSIQPDAKLTTYTNTEGQFRLESLPLKRFVATARMEGYYGIRSALLSPRVRARGIQITLEPAGQISGKVSAIDGTPVEGVQIIPILHDGETVSSPGMANRIAVSGQDGAFTVAGLEPTLWSLYAASESYAAVETAQVPVGTDNLDIVLEPGYPLIGRTVDGSTGDPVPGINVTAKRSNTNAPAQTARSNRSGEFVFPALALAQYQLGVRNDKYVVLEPVPEVHVSPGAPPVTLKVSKGGSIAGRVIDSQTGEGIERVEVIARPSRGRGMAAMGPAPAHSPERRAATNESGEYLVEGLSPAIYDVYPEDHVPGVYSTTLPPRPTEVQVAPDDEIRGIDFKLDLGVRVIGTLVDQEGIAVAGAALSLETIGDEQGRSNQTLTGEAGQFAFTSVPVGMDLQIKAKTDRIRNQVVGSLVVPEEGVQDLNLVLNTATDGIVGTITGIVVDQTGQPIRAEVLAMPLPEGKSYPYRAESDLKGEFFLLDLPAGDYQLAIKIGRNPLRPIGTYTVTAGQTLGGVRLVYEGDATLSIEGRVEDDTGQPLEASVIMNPGGNRKAHADGTFAFRNLEEGTYTLIPALQGYDPMGMEQVAAGTTGVVLRLKKSGASLTGRVVDAAQQPVTQFRITTMLIADMPVQPRVIPVSHPEGRFDFPLNQGRYTLEVEAEGYLPEQVDNVRVGSAGSGEIVVTLKPGDSSVAGIVVDARGQGVSGAHVFKGGASGSEGNVAAQTDSGGAFTIHGVIPDRPLILSARHADHGYGTAQTTPRANATQQVRIVLNAVGSITGRVLMDGQEVIGATVVLSGDGGTSQSAITNPRRGYVFANLAPGLYTVSTTVQLSDDGTPPLTASRQAEVAGNAETAVDLEL
ncbi:MAG: hypothetical protein AMXMBFR84_03590 [Candidatus Hydrogenedentota bacterium]